MGASFSSSPGPLPKVIGHATAVTPSGFRIHAMRTGFVGVKRTHRELNVPASLAVPAIFLGSEWAPWMPVISYAVEAPNDGGVFILDTGVAASADTDPGAYYSPDPSNAFFYLRNLRLRLPAGDALADRLSDAGIAPSSVRGVVLSHLHADHVGGLDAVSHAPVYTGRGNWPAHVGSFTAYMKGAPTEARFEARGPPRRLPPGSLLSTASSGSSASGQLSDGAHGGGSDGGCSGASERSLTCAGPGDGGTAFHRLFPDTHALTPDGAVAIVPLPGHTPGHVGLAVLDAGRVWLMAGDATFNVDQTLRCGVCGVSQDVALASATQRHLRSLLDEAVAGTAVLLPAHDPDAFGRLQASSCPPLS
jgi:N-acyl homoserine lactone hydrolase